MNDFFDELDVLIARWNAASSLDEYDYIAGLVHLHFQGKNMTKKKNINGYELNENQQRKYEEIKQRRQQQQQEQKNDNSR